jgi:methyl acetate hydrolase
VEGITGKRLGQVMQERIFEPLGMTSSAFVLTPSMRARLARIHQRESDGSLKPLDLELPQEPEVHMGGHGLYATVPDYCRFIRMWLNDGAGEKGRVLKAETVRMAERNGLGEKKIKGLPGVIPSLSNYAEFFPGMPKTWGLGFMISTEAVPGRRSANALAWAGLGNTYFWIDPASQVCGVILTQILPFADPKVLALYDAFETAVYAGQGGRKAA